VYKLNNKNEYKLIVEVQSSLTVRIVNSMTVRLNNRDLINPYDFSVESIHRILII
jgi:hypothetical protein